MDSTQATSGDASDALPAGVHLTPVYPNPFTHLAKFDLAIDQPQHVKIEVFDMLGRSIHLVHDGFLAASEKRTFELDGRDWTNGIYLFQIEGELFAQSRPIVLIR